MKTPSLLVVDDDPALRQWADLALGERFSVRCAGDCADAIGQLETQPADAILLDVDLPGTDGLNTCRRIRQLPGAGQTPILLMSAFISSFLETEAPAAGAAGILKKPLDAQATIDRLETLL